MLMPSIFNSNFDLLNNFYDPWFSDHELKDVEKKLYGHNAKNVMSTDAVSYTHLTLPTKA